MISDVQCQLKASHELIDDVFRLALTESFRFSNDGFWTIRIPSSETKARSGKSESFRILYAF